MSSGCRPTSRSDLRSSGRELRVLQVAFDTLPPCPSGATRGACPEWLGSAFAYLPTSLLGGVISRAAQVFMGYRRRHQQQLRQGLTVQAALQHRFHALKTV